MKTLLLFFLIGTASAADLDCYTADPGYPTHITVNTDKLEMRVMGHRQSYRGFATEYSNPFDVQFTMNHGSEWFKLVLQNGNTQLAFCQNGRPCQPCR